MPQPLLLADAPALLYRGFFALPDTIVAPDGMPVNALLGSINALLQVVEEHDPRAVVMCFGQESATYRVEAYPPYHAQRPAMPKGLAQQWRVAPELYAAFGWPALTDPGLEADDLLHSLALAEAASGGEALILTGDRDLYQSVREGVTVLIQRAARGGRAAGVDAVDAEEVRARYGIGPELVPDFIALRGDPSDGLPGAKGIGEKTAAELLGRHGSLEAAIAGAVRERPAVRHPLLAQADELRMFKDVATLREVALERPPDRPTDRDGGAAAAEALGMRRLAERLRA